MFTIFRSMHGRLFLLLLVGMVVAVASTILLTHSRRQEIYQGVRTQHLVAEIGMLVETLKKIDSQKRNAFLHSFRSMGIHGRVTKQSLLPITDRDKLLEIALQRRMPNVTFIAQQPNRMACADARLRRPRRSHAPRLCQRVNIILQDYSGFELTIPVPPMRERPYPPLVLSAILLFAAFISLLAWLVARIATRPLRQLADAADGFDITRISEPLPENGSSEVRTATRAFNRMQKRIYEDVRERTGMLAAIAHDLQTPLTRLRLRLEKLPDETLRDKLVGDMQAMQQMLQEGLELARSLDNSEAKQLLDLDSLLDSLCSDAVDAGQQVNYGERTAARMKAHPLALRRALSNLLDNAVKYGQRAEVSLNCDAHSCHIRILDFGPGIPPELLETVFTPFYRVEHSRSRETGGTGLGLAIARNIVQRHSGELTLSNRPTVGLQVDVVLPISA